MPLPALTRLSMPQQRPPWTLSAASAIDNALEPIADQFGVSDLRTATVPLVLHDGTRTVPRPMNNPTISLDEAIRRFRQSAQPPPFVSVATTHAATTVVSDSHQGPNAASTAAVFDELRLPSIFSC